MFNLCQENTTNMDYTKKYQKINMDNISCNKNK